jgi:N-acetylmuramoyl-L-alanine amidase
MVRHTPTVLLFAATLSACGGRTILDKPVPFPEERVQLTRDYMRDHYGVDAASIDIVPRIVVLHWTAGKSLAGDFNTFAPTTLRGRADLREASQLNVGIQFLVDRDGRIYRLMPETWMARHVIGLNYNAIGVENVGGAQGIDDLTPEQRAANVWLVRYLAKKYPTIEYLIGHHEYRLFEGHPLWLERDTAYRTTKSDPGDAFMAAVRAKVADLRLKGPPAK